MAPVEEAANLLQAGAKAHKNGDLKAAEDLNSTDLLVT